MTAFTADSERRAARVAAADEGLEVTERLEELIKGEKRDGAGVDAGADTEQRRNRLLQAASTSS